MLKKDIYIKKKVENMAKPFLKWAGGKSQLINIIEKELPLDFNRHGYTYIEPFVGSGAMLFWVLNKYPNIRKAIINDINVDLINAYKTVRYDVEGLISILKTWETEYHGLSENQEQKKIYFYEKRRLFNQRNLDRGTQAALFIFLNRTCFNGLYRVNRKNEFNVPIGSYKQPVICHEDNLQAVHRVLQNVEILNTDFAETLKYAKKKTLFYFDPPYKPLSRTSSFNAYSKDNFNDEEQIRLAEFCKKIDKSGHTWILSNSDVRGKNPEDDFFDRLYADYRIIRVKARRIINSDPDKRGELNELLITNQPKHSQQKQEEFMF